MKDDRLFLAWLAGFMDGEGSLSVSITKKVHPTGRSSLIISSTICIHQHVSRRAVLDQIREHFGFGVVYTRLGKMAHYQPTNRGDAKAFLTAVLPYLRVKAPQAKAMMKAIDILAANTRNGVRLCKGEHALSREAAEQLAGIAIGLNEREIGGGRKYGHSLEGMKAIIAEVYGQSFLEPKRSTISCTGCGKQVERYFSAIESSQHQFCSKACASDWVRRTYPTRFKVDVTCVHCGKTFQRIKSDVKPTRNFCSRRCSNGATGQERVRKVELRCTGCGTTFQRVPSKVSSGVVHFCSRGCRNRWYPGSAVRAISGGAHA